MRIAILSDIHGNTIALDAVLKDIQARGGVDEYWILGDIAAIGHDPVGAIERVAALPNARVIRGNTDRYLTDGHRPGPSLDEAIQNPRLLPTVIETAASFAWTQGALAKSRGLDWLAVLPLDYRVTLPDDTHVLLVHASPGYDDGKGILPNMSESDLESRLADCNADLIFVGHHHLVMDLQVNHIHIINPGSVSNSFPPDLRASYGILEADKTDHRFQFLRVDYDRDAVIAQLVNLRHPGAKYISGFMRGQHTSPWMNPVSRDA